MSAAGAVTREADGNAQFFRMDGVSRRYGDVVALDDVTLSVGNNEYVSLLGPSGSGKTTLLRVIAGFEPPDSGRLRFGDQDIGHLPAYRRNVGFVFQNFALFPHMSVMDNITYGLLNAEESVPEDEARRRAGRVLEMVGLSGLESRGVEQISGGQKQRVALARTLVKEPPLVLLDEPLGALDANLRARMRDELRSIREELGVTFLHVTGSETEALAMGDRVAVLDAGTILQVGRPDDVYDTPATPNVARFLNRYNLFEGRLLGDGSFEGPFGKAPAPDVRRAETPLYCIRFDRITAAPQGTATEGPSLEATFVASEYFGSSMIYFFEMENGQHVELEHHMSLGAPPDFANRTRYVLHWKPEDAIVFG